MYLNSRLENKFNVHWDGDYNSSLGRFISEDPIGFNSQDYNLYRYADNNPIFLTDPFGLYSWDDFLSDYSNFSAGFGDTITFGGTAYLRNVLGSYLGHGSPIVNKCSTAYSIGKYTSYGVEVYIGGALTKRLLKLQINFLSKGNVFKIISQRLRFGFRIDPAHHGKRWGHTHFWRWKK